MRSAARVTAVSDDVVPAGYTAIYTAEDLNNIRNDLSGKYILMNDINLSSIDNWEPIGSDSARFTGTFDGNGHVIKNLTINRPDGQAAGLFGYTNKATIKNLGLENVDVSGNNNVGGLLGWHYQASISNCYADKKDSDLSAIGKLESSSNITNTEMIEHSVFTYPGFWYSRNLDSDVWDLSTAPPTLKNMPAPSPPAPSGTGGNIRLQVGPNSDPTTNAIYLDISFNLEDLVVDFSTEESCLQTVEDVDALLNTINNKLASIGAIQNRLDSVEQSQITQIENFSAAKSTIMDADLAEISAEYAKQQILNQTSIALLVQANHSSSSIALNLINHLR